MALFLSTYINKVDSKGRVSVPAPFRAALSGQSFQGAFHGVVLFRSHSHACLEGFSWATMEEIGGRLDKFALFSDEQDDLATTIFGEAVQLPFDGEGRVLLPQDLVSFAGLSENAAFVGMGRKFQVWSPEAYDKRRNSARDSVKKKGLTLPAGGAS